MDDRDARDDQATNRRGFLVKAGAVGVAAWVAPVVVSRPALAATSGPPTSGPPGCDPCGATAIVNGSFEVGTDGWTGAFLVEQYPFFNFSPAQPAGDLFAAQLGRVAQTVDVDPACAGADFRLTFLFANFSGTQASATVAFSDGTNPVGAPVVLDLGATQGQTLLTTRELTGFVPGGATQADVHFDNNSIGAIDLVELTICR
jgi:hypothetical protein